MQLTPALRELDSIVVNIELTLSSIVQGVALTFLVENTRSVLSIHNADTWLYVLVGLCIIFIFWSRSIMHTITLIRWPLEFGHNFLYIACTLVECLLFTCLADPKAWFEISTLYAIAVWYLFVYDTRMTRLRDADRPSRASSELSRLIEYDQRLNIRLLMPGLAVFSFLAVCAIRFWPGFFVARHGHIGLIAGQFGALAIYLCYVLRFFRKLAPTIETRQEERYLLGQEQKPQA